MTFHNKVEPMVFGKKSKMMSSQWLSMSSMSSLSPSLLDRAITETLNIKNHCYFKNCAINPISEKGKRLQLMKMMGITLVPISILMLLVSIIFYLKINESFAAHQVRSQLHLSSKMVSLIHALQKERGMSTLFISSSSGGSRGQLTEEYRHTDNIIMNLPSWPDEHENTAVGFPSKTEFISSLNSHRYLYDPLTASEKAEQVFYSNRIEVIISWCLNAVTEIGSGTTWKMLVTLQEAIQATEMLDRERAYGAMYFARGSFESKDDYLTFVYSQDAANDSLHAATLYSKQAADLHRDIMAKRPLSFWDELEAMRHSVRQIAFHFVKDNNSQAQHWSEKMSLYLADLYELQDQLITRIELLLMENQKGDRRLLGGLGTLAISVLLFCPSILNAVRLLTDHMQKFSSSLVDRTRALHKEKRKTDALLYQMIPKKVAEQLKVDHELVAEEFTDVTLFFSDIVGFTSICSSISPIQTVGILDSLYTLFDSRIQLYDVYKVETIGDAYLVASGLPKRNGNRHSAEIATMSLDLLDRIHMVDIPHAPEMRLKLRIGIHTGRVVAGVVGTKMPRYCIFGEAVHIAANMEQTGKAGNIHISQSTYEALSKIGNFKTTPDEPVQWQSLSIPTYWLHDRYGMIRLPQSTSSSAVDMCRQLSCESDCTLHSIH